MNKKKLKKLTASDTKTMSIAYIPSITSHSSLPYVSEAVFLGEILKNG
jgi:hypothetical protein